MTQFLNVSGDFVIYVAIFLGILLIFEGLRQMLSRDEDENRALNRRMRFRQKGATTQDLHEKLLEMNAALDDTSIMARFNRLL
ncbi:hypothetical protein HA397_24305, partial [Escherichia coli]|nr:hypothetical protein [Escherichia coli]